MYMCVCIYIYIYLHIHLHIRLRRVPYYIGDLKRSLNLENSSRADSDASVAKGFGFQFSV